MPGEFERVVERVYGALTTEVWLPPPDVHAFSGTRSSIVGHRTTQAILAVGAGANIITAVLQVGQRADCVVAGLEFGGRQERASLLRKPGCCRERKASAG